MTNIIKSGVFSRNILLCIIVAATCTGCTHLQTNPTGQVPSIAAGQPATAGAQRGLSYPLPMLQYDLKVTRLLEACPLGVPRISVKATTSERYVAGERFEVNYEALSSIMKTTNFDITYHESGTIKTINATARDQTGPVLTDIARIGLAVAGIAGGVPAPLLATSPSALAGSDKSALEGRVTQPATDGRSAEATLRCTPAAVLLLSQLETATNDVRRLTRETNGLIADVARLGALAELDVMSDADKALLSVKVRALLMAEGQLRAAVDLVATRQSDLSVVQELTWPERAGDSSSTEDAIPPDAASLEKLWSLVEVQTDGVTLTREGQQQVMVSCPRQVPLPVALRPAFACLTEITSLNLRLVPAVTQSVQPEVATAIRDRSAIILPMDRRWARGIFIREPVEARLIVCLAPAQVTSTGCSDRTKVVLRDKLLIAPQLGRLRLLPFTNGPFENSGLQLSVRANGFIEHFQYGRESSAAAASSTLAGIAERTQVALEAMETERRNDIQYQRDSRTYERNEVIANRTEELAQLTHQVNLLKAQGELLAQQLALSGASDTSPYAAERLRIEAEVQLLQARIARLTAANQLATLATPTTN